MKAPELAPGETLSVALPDIGLAIYKSGINYRAVPTLPLIQNVGFYMTDRRAILRGEVFMNLYDQDVDFWFPEYAPSPASEVITSVTAERGDFVGSYLVIATRSEREHLLRSKDAVFQIFTTNAEALIHHFPAPLIKG